MLLVGVGKSRRVTSTRARVESTRHDLTHSLHVISSTEQKACIL